MKLSFKEVLTNRAVGLALWFFRAQIFVTRSRSKFYLKCFANCVVACVLEAWSKITAGKPVDFNSPLYKTIKQVVEYYLYRSFRERTDPTFFEKLILQHEFAMATQSAGSSPAEVERNFKFVLKHRLARILKRYESTFTHIAWVASVEISKAEGGIKEGPSASYWSARTNSKKPPKHLTAYTRKLLLWRLRRDKARVQREIAQNNILKLDFTASDISSLVALSGTLLILLGYSRIAVLCWYLNVSCERYFTITDYLSSSVSAVQIYLLSAALTIVAVWFLEIAPTNAYSLQQNEWRQKRFGERLTRWMFHFLTISAAISAAFLFYRGEIVAAVAPASIVGMYSAFYLLAYVSRTYFTNPMKFYLYAALVAMCTINGLSGVAREIGALTSFNANQQSRVLHFENADYSEPSWRVVAITSGFVILRRQLDGAIHVRNKSDLKSVVDSAPR